MGDCGNIIVKQGRANASVYLYTHWSGSETPEILQNVLKRRKRWDDAPYLTRMIFCEMVKGEESGDSGFGITTWLTDNEHDILEVDPDTETVSLLGKNDKVSWTFEEFCKIENIKNKEPGDLVE